MRQNEQLLHPAVMTSSSERELSELFNEVRDISGVDWFDLIVPRRADLIRLGIDSGRLERMERMARLVADDDCFRLIRDDILKKTAECDVKVSALATYFPDVTSQNPQDRDTAVQAIANTVRIAVALSQQKRKDDSPCMDFPIVEVVCGTIIDPGAEGPASEFRDVWDRDYKLDLLCQTLHQCIFDLRADPQIGANSSFVLAVEMEPGETYVLNSQAAMLKLLDRIEGRSPVFDRDHKLLDHKLLEQHVGFNIDVAHMRIARIYAQELEPLQHRIAHAHISDHPLMHTHDQYVGSWTNPGFTQGGYREYLDLLLRRSHQFAEKKGFPFSNAVAVELEGCNRIFWIHDSLTRLNHSLAIARRRYLPAAAAAGAPSA